MPLFTIILALLYSHKSLRASPGGAWALGTVLNVESNGHPESLAGPCPCRGPSPRFRARLVGHGHGHDNHAEVAVGSTTAENWSAQRWTSSGFHSHCPCSHFRCASAECLLDGFRHRAQLSTTHHWRFSLQEVTKVFAKTSPIFVHYQFRGLLFPPSGSTLLKLVIT